MINTKSQKLIRRIALTLLAISMLMCIFAGLMPTSVYATDSSSKAVVGLKNIEGSFFWGTEGITDPEKITNDNGYYYQPTSYIYFGEVYNTVTQSYEPIVCRVLDADADNTGASGAIFLLTEKTVDDTLYLRKYYVGYTDSMRFENIYTESEIFLYDSNPNEFNSYINGTVSEVDYVRAVTKEDFKEVMNRAFGYIAEVSEYSWETDTCTRNSEGFMELFKTDSAVLLNNRKFFLLSVDEILNYMGNYNGAPPLWATDAATNNSVVWWLRTGMEETYNNYDSGEYVGAVDQNGNVIPVSVEDASVRSRFGFNLLTEDIVYTQNISGVRKLALLHPMYKNNTENPFEARVFSVKDGVVTIKYSNAIRTYTKYGTDDETEYVSVIIKDKETGKIKHYNSISAVEETDPDKSEQISDTELTASFRLPTSYNEETDSILVFWERKQGNEESASYISNMVELDCFHTYYDEATGKSGKLPTCVELGTCALCEEKFGFLDPSNHASVDESTYYNEYFPEENVYKHWNKCSDCDEIVNLTRCNTGNTCMTTCDCGRSSPKHSYDENGICIFNAHHYQSPVYENVAGGTSVTISSKGQWLSFAETVNKGPQSIMGDVIYDINGERVNLFYTVCYIYLTEDLDFADTDYIPIGNGDNHLWMAVIRTTKENLTIKNINYTSEDSDVGLFGVISSLEIINPITVTNCSFKGASNVGIIVGRATSFLTVKNIIALDTTVTATQDASTEGALAGYAKDATITSSLAYNVKNEGAEDLAFIGSGSINAVGSACLYKESGENGERTAEQFASGQVAYEMNANESGSKKGWGQIIDIEGEEPELYPTLYTNVTDDAPVSNKVYKDAYCTGEIICYTNNLSEDASRHSFVEFIEFQWNYDHSCNALAYCEKCQSRVLTPAKVYWNLEYVPVRDEYTASITVNGEYYESETLVFVGIYLQDMIGMTYIEKDFDGQEIYPEDMMDNHRLNTGTPYPAAKEYEAYFVDPVTGNRYEETGYDYYMQEYKYPASVMAAGTYDLLIIGKNDYEGQEYTYKGALVIKPVTLNITPLDVYKHYDGNTDFTLEYTTDNDELLEYNKLFELVISEPNSNSVGSYELNVSIEKSSDEYLQNYHNSITYNLTRATIKASILPQISVELSNKNYPTKLTYGDTAPTPSADYFNISEGSTLSFEWYSADLYIWEHEIAPNVWEEQYEILSMSKIEGIPRAAGDYILRAKASGTDTLVGTYTDIWIQIKRRSIDFELVAPEGSYMYTDDYGYPYYTIEAGEKIGYEITGLVNGNTPESAGIYVEISASDNSKITTDTSVFPYVPSNEAYRIEYYPKCVDAFGEEGSYYFGENEYSTSLEVVYAYIKAPVHASVNPMEYMHDGEVKNIQLNISWSAVDGANEYYVSIQDENGNVSEITVNASEVDASRPSYIYALKNAGKYIVTVSNDASSDKEVIEITLGITDDDENVLTEIVDIGKYTVSVAQNSETVSSADIIVKRKITMYVKECEFNITDGSVEFDIKNIKMKAGEVILLNHTLVDAELVIDMYNGEIQVASLTVYEGDKDVSYLYELDTVVYSWRHENGGSNVVHIFYAECDSTCNVYGCEYTRAATHTGGNATCASLAVCEYCSAPYGEYNVLNHEGSETHIIPNGENLETHIEIYTCCGLTKEVLPHAPRVVATCTTLAVCADCDWSYGELDPTNHSSDECTYEYSDRSSHIKTHLCCGAPETEEHSGGEATCTSLAVCQYCNKEYGVLNPDNHSGHIDYIPSENDQYKHTEIYNCCQTSAVVKHSGKASTCNSLAVCDLCKAEYGELDPDNHATQELTHIVREDNASMHDIYRSCCNEYLGKEYHKGGEATCNGGALCEYCGTEYGTPDKSKHASTEYEYKIDPSDSQKHIKAYACCGEEISSEAHTGGSANCQSGALCELCRTEYTEKTEHSYDNNCTSVCATCGESTRALSFHTDENDDGVCDGCGIELEKKSISGSGVSAIVTGSTVAAGAGVFSLIWFAIKKKGWAALLKLFIG